MGMLILLFEVMTTNIVKIIVTRILKAKNK